MSNVVFIIGNGFNFMIQNIIDNIPIKELEATQVLTRRNVADNIRSITLLWKKFQLVFDELRAHFIQKGNNISDEYLIKLINSVINFFSNLEGFEKILTPDDIKKLRSVFDKFLLNKISEIAEEFRIHQERKSYKLIRKYFPGFSKSIVETAENNNLKRVAFFTTNYDGILDTLLTTIPKGFPFKDGFGRIVEDNGSSSKLEQSGNIADS
ncbi:hypothetical protein [Hymenobacter rigui]|uniref:Uncharacterized protein n=1 Tax=Hymenobacter rigui TaxID=334424 RepID=A0A3R9PZH3_9BACT|nr:hypothetical protein [Hymenobacter rigui]RSK49632.1 hypothetical protein EI291_09080 [Hymenobacter rigui]